jgi:hypothetical protein
MKPILTAFLALACLAMTTTFALAEETTITGMGKCAKEHSTAVQVEEDGKTVTYYLAENDVSKNFHSKICSKAAKIKVTGEVKKVGARLEMTASKIELLAAR